ncbi:MAG: hypothetical protein EAZ87_16855, partial [Nostocales cyanobacterium]
QGKRQKAKGKREETFSDFTFCYIPWFFRADLLTLYQGGKPCDVKVGVFPYKLLLFTLIIYFLFY